MSAQPSLLVIVAGDPRTSPRPAEAIRIAAGVGAWKRAELSVYLRGPAVLALSEYPDELIDGDNYVRYLPIIAEFGRPIYIQEQAPLLREIGPAAAPFEEISDQRLAEMAAQSTYVARF